MKEEAAAVLVAMGLTVSDAVRLLLMKVAQEKALPFAPLVPNAVSIEAMKEARRGKLERFGSVHEVLDDLHEDDWMATIFSSSWLSMIFSGGE